MQQSLGLSAEVGQSEGILLLRSDFGQHLMESDMFRVYRYSSIFRSTYAISQEPV